MWIIDVAAPCIPLIQRCDNSPSSFLYNRYMHKDMTTAESGSHKMNHQDCKIYFMIWNFFSQTVHSHLVDSCSKTRKKVLIIIKISYFVHSHGSTTAPSDTQLKCICIPSRDIRSICSNFYWLWMTSSIKFIEFCQFRFRMRLVIKKSYFKYKRQI